MGQLSGTIHRFSTGPERKDLSRYRDNTGTKSGTNEMAEICGFYDRDKSPGQFSGQGWDNGTSGTKGYKPCPVVPAQPALVFQQVMEAGQ